jgi:putative transposase
MCRVWCGRDNWATLALVIDCHTRELLGWHLSRSGRSKTAESALEQALIARYGHLGVNGALLFPKKGAANFPTFGISGA